MARELVTHIWCDACLATPEGEEPVYTKAEELPPTTMGAMKPRLLALCEPHRKEYYDPFRELLQRLGQVVPDTGPRAVSAAPAAPGRKVWPCPVPTCPRHTQPFSNKTSRSSHAQREHGATITQLRQQYPGAPSSETDQEQGVLLHDQGVLAGEPITGEGQHNLGKPPAVTHTKCDQPGCDAEYVWPSNARPAQALGVHKAKKHGIKGDPAKAHKAKA